MSTLTPFEHTILEKFFDGDHPALATLRRQLQSLRVLRREYTGVGFFTDFVCPVDAPALEIEGKCFWGDVRAELEGLENGAGFVLVLECGRIATLEGYTYGEPWPKDPRVVSLAHFDRARYLAELESRPRGAV